MHLGGRSFSSDIQPKQPWALVHPGLEGPLRIPLLRIAMLRKDPMRHHARRYWRPATNTSRAGLGGSLRQATLPHSRQHFGFTSVLVARAHGQERAGVGYGARKSDTPLTPTEWLCPTCSLILITCRISSDLRFLKFRSRDTNVG